jgi:hypothetical protein
VSTLHQGHFHRRSKLHLVLDLPALTVRTC